MLVQEIEPQTWNKLAHRIDGASSIKHIKKNSFTCPNDLPYMFKDWEEYAIHLAENIIQDDDNKKKLYKVLNSNNIEHSSKFYKRFNQNAIDKYWQIIINTILSSDWDFTKIKNFAMSMPIAVLRYYYWKQFHKMQWEKIKHNKYFTYEQKQEIWNQLSK
jgi:hypothetical protein